MSCPVGLRLKPVLSGCPGEIFTIRSTSSFLFPVLKFLFSAHISYGKGKYLNQTVFFFFFFLQNLPRFYLYLNLRVLPIEFNPHKFIIFRPYFIWERKIFKSNGFFFLFSAHISYGKGKYLNQTVFFFFFFFFTKFAKILFIFKFKGVTHRIQPT